MAQNFSYLWEKSYCQIKILFLKNEFSDSDYIFIYIDIYIKIYIQIFIYI